MIASNQRTRTPPTNAQAAAYKHLRSNAKRIAATIQKRILVNYGELQGQYVDFVEPDEMPDITDPDDLRQLIAFSGVYLHRVAKKGISYAGVQLDCTWDNEHGLGVMMHRSRVVKLGGADTALLEWVAEAHIWKLRTRVPTRRS
jgi:hypothetical protein